MFRYASVLLSAWVAQKRPEGILNDHMMNQTEFKRNPEFHKYFDSVFLVRTHKMYFNEKAKDSEVLGMYAQCFWNRPKFIKGVLKEALIREDLVILDEIIARELDDQYLSESEIKSMLSG